jgi:hypothetical protein
MEEEDGEKAVKYTGLVYQLHDLRVFFSTTYEG